MESYSVKAVLSATDNMSGVFQKAARSAGSFRQKMGSSLQAVGKTSTVLGLAVGAMTGKAIKSYGDFQESINKAAVIAGSSNKKLGSNMKDLEKVALSLGKTLPISAEDAGNAMIEMARNGASIKDLKKEFPSIAKAAAVSGADLSATATTVQQAMNIWGGGAKNAAKDSATLAIVANKSNAEVGDMQQVFANVGTTAKNMGYSLKDVSIAAGVMTNAGIPAAQASMDLNHAFSQMVKPSKTAQGEMQKLGLSYTNAQGEMKPLKTVIKDVANATKGMSGAQKTAALNMLFGSAGAKAMAPLIDSVGDKAKKSGKGWDSFSSAIDKGAGTAKKANKYLNENSQNMTKNVGQSLAQMADAFDALVKTSIGSIAPQIRDVADALGDFATWLNNSKSPLAGFVKKLIALSPIIAGVLVVFGLLATGVGKLISAFSAPVKAIKKFGGSAKDAGKYAGISGGQLAGMGAKAAGIGIGIGAAAAGIGVLAFGIAALAKTGKKGLVALAAMTGAIVILAATFAILKGPLTAAIPAMVALSATMLAAGASALMIGGAIALAGTGINLAAQGVMILVQAFILLGNNINMIIPLLTVLGAGLAALVVTFLSRVISAVPQIATQFLTMFATLLNMIATYTPVLVAGFAHILIGFITALTNYVPQIALAITNMLVAMMNAVATNAPLLIAAFTNMVVSIINALAAALPQFITAGTNFIVSILEGIASNIGRVISAAIDVVVAFINGIASNLGRVINAGINLLGKFLLGIANAIPKLASVGIKAVLRFVQGVGNAIGQALASGGKVLSAFVKGIIQGFGKASNAGKGAGSKGASGASSTRGLFSNAGRALLSALASAISSLGGRVMSAAKSAASRGASGARSAMGAFRSAGSNLVSGLVNGIRSMAGSVMSAASNLASRAAATIKKALKIHSPSRVTFGFGSYFGEGFVNGISSMQKQVQRVAGGMGNMASDALNSNVQALNSRVNGSISSNFTTTMDQSPIDNVANKVIAAIREGHDIVLDGNTLVGHTADRMDNHLGNNTRLGARFS